MIEEKKKSLALLLEENKEYLVLLPTNKIKCKLSGHEMPPSSDMVLQYINSKSFKKSLEWYSFDFSKYLPHVVDDNQNSRKLYCKLTKQHLNKVPLQVEKHVNGKRFLRLKSEFETKLASAPKKRDNDVEDHDAEFWMPSEINDELESADEIEDDDYDETLNDEELYDSDIDMPIIKKQKVSKIVALNDEELDKIHIDIPIVKKPKVSKKVALNEEELDKIDIDVPIVKKQKVSKKTANKGKFP